MYIYTYIYIHIYILHFPTDPCILDGYIRLGMSWDLVARLEGVLTQTGYHALLLFSMIAS